MVLANTNTGQDDVRMAGHTETPELPSPGGKIGFRWELRESPGSDSQGQDEPQQAIPAPPGKIEIHRRSELGLTAQAFAQSSHIKAHDGLIL